MEYRVLRDSDLEISNIVLGTAFRGGLVEEMANVIQRALDLGINTFDTGGYVRNGVVTEQVLGSVIENRRQDVILAVKIVPPSNRDIEKRLRNLRTDYIDILEILPCRCDVVCKSGYPGHVDEPHYSVTDAMVAAEKLIEKGMVRYLGVSRYTTAQLQEAETALNTTALLTNQLGYNLVATEVGDEAMDYCRANQVDILACSPLGAGLLLGDSNPAVERLARYDFDAEEKANHYGRINGVLTAVAEEAGKTVAQVALNWILCQEIVLPIIGPDRVEHVEENCGGVGWRLNEDQLRRIEGAVQPDPPITLPPPPPNRRR